MIEISDASDFFLGMFSGFAILYLVIKILAERSRKSKHK